MARKLMILAFTLIIFTEGFPQIKIQGTPFIRNYTSVDYGLHPNNYSILQDDRGLMYFGNAYGVLEFDGNTWNHIDLPSGKSGISLAKGDSGKVYVGSVNDVGYLTSDSLGNPVYATLIEKVKESDRNFEEVWKTFCVHDEVAFISLSKILLYRNNAVEVFTPSNPEMVFDFSAEVSGQIFIRESGMGLMSLINGEFKMASAGDFFADELIYAILPYEHNKLLIVSSDGLDIYDGKSLQRLQCPLNNIVQEHQATKGIRLTNGDYALGTVKQGIIIFNEKGETVQWLSKNNGLISDYVVDLFIDVEDNLWVATDVGISYVHSSSPLTTINENSNLQGLGYAAFVNDNKLYLGTSQGLFYKSLNEFQNTSERSSGFQQVKNVQEQVWYLAEAGGILLCGDTRGLSMIRNNESTLISPGEYTGGWIFRTLKNENYLLLGTYAGLELYEKRATTWVYKNKVRGFNESSRALEIDDKGNVWVCHGNNGLYKMHLNEEMDSVTNVTNVSLAHGFKPNFFNDIVKIENEIVFASDKALYTYDESADDLRKYDPFNRFIGEDALVTRIGYHQDGKIWIVNHDVIETITRQHDGTFVLSSGLFRKVKEQIIGSFEFFWRYNDQNYFIGTQEGFVHFDPTITKGKRDINTLIRKIESINMGDSLLIAGAFQAQDSLSEFSTRKILTIPYIQNALRFSYSVLFFEDHDENQYQYYLQNDKEKSKGWTTWTDVTYKEYTNLPEGDYTFHVRARNVYGQISDDTTFSFTILPPWYRTKAAYIVYAICAALFLTLVTRLILIKFQREKRRIEKEKEQEIILLRNEKLEAEVRYKNNELANLATNLSQKTEFLTQLKNDLVTINKENNPEISSQSLSQLIKNVEKGIDFDDTWDHFQTNFDNVYHNFLFTLRQKFPALKSTDLLLCAYIRMNKSNKEISTLLNISESAVKKRRVRLKDKFSLDDDTRLIEFLLEI